jgi:hypothetical protein
VTDPLNFTSTIDLADGRRIYVSIEIPADHPAGLAWRHVSENGEIAHMAASHAMKQLLRGDESRDRDRAEEIAEFNASIVAKLNDGPVF